MPIAKIKKPKTVTQNLFGSLKKLGRAGMSNKRLRELTGNKKKKK